MPIVTSAGIYPITMPRWLIYSPEIGMHIIGIGVDTTSHHAPVDPLRWRKLARESSWMSLACTYHSISAIRMSLLNATSKLVRIHSMVHMGNWMHSLNLDMIAHVAAKLGLIPE